MRRAKDQACTQGLMAKGTLLSTSLDSLVHPLLADQRMPRDSAHLETSTDRLLSTELAVHHTPEEGLLTTSHGARLTYNLDSSKNMVITHTFVPETLRGQGIAALLMRAAVLLAKQNNLSIEPRCSYAEVYLKRHNPDLATASSAHLQTPHD